MIESKDRVWTRSQRINYYLNWGVMLIIYLLPISSALNGEVPKVSHLGPGMVISGLIYAHIWKLVNQNKWRGAGIGAFMYIVVFVFCNFVASYVSS